MQTRFNQIVVLFGLASIFAVSCTPKPVKKKSQEIPKMNIAIGRVIISDFAGTEIPKWIREIVHEQIRRWIEIEGVIPDRLEVQKQIEEAITKEVSQYIIPIAESTLLRTKRFNVVTRTQVESILKEQMLTLIGLTIEEEYNKLQQLTGAEAIISITISLLETISAKETTILFFKDILTAFAGAPSGSRRSESSFDYGFPKTIQLDINAQLIKVSSGKILSSHSARAPGIDKVQATLQKISNEIAKDISLQH